MDGFTSVVTHTADVAGVLAVVAAGLLVPAGLAKLRRPSDARAALGLTDRRAEVAVRTIGLGEVMLAAWVLLVGGVLAAGALAVAYLGFAVVAARQRRQGADCGCFGATSAPTGRLHVAVDLVAAACALGVAATGGVAPLHTLLAGGPVLVATSVVLLGVAVASVQLVLTRLPDLAAAVRAGTDPVSDRAGATS